MSIMVDSIGDTARKASAGTWRKPRVRIYDYNNVSQIAICLGVKLLKSCVALGSGQQLLSTNDQVHQSEGYLWSFYGKETCGNARQT